jgi:sensor domain CHASE-containing protein
MKLALAVLVALLLFLAWAAIHEASLPIEMKTIASKHEGIAPRVSMIDTVTSDGNAVVTRSESVYYLVANDGSYCEASLGEYLRTQPGASYGSKHWYR